MNLNIEKSVFIMGILFLGLLILISPNLYSEDSGFKYFKNYSYWDYDHQPQNWAIIQDKNGIIYVGNNGGLLEFDGVSWRLINLPNYTVRSLAIDNDGKVYIGGNSEIGYLIQNSQGFLQYASLVEHLEKHHRHFGNVVKTIFMKEGIYFCTEKFLFRWNPQSKKIKAWEPTRPNHIFFASFLCKGKLFIQQKKLGIMQMLNDSLELLPGSGIFAEEDIYMMVPYDANTNAQALLIGIPAKGFYMYDGITAKPFPTEVDDYLKQNEVYHGIRLSSGDFALATNRGGLVIIDFQGRLKYIFNKSFGLQDDNVKHVFEDFQGNLWLGLDKGISKIEYASPFFLYDNRADLPGIVLSVKRHQEKLYVGTTWGLFVLKPQSTAFKPVPGISSNCWSLVSSHDSILAAASTGVFQVRQQSKQKIINDRSYVLLLSRHFPQYAWCGTRRGLVMLHRENGQWREAHRFNTITESIRSMAEEKNHNLWLGTLTRGTIKLHFSDNIHQPVITSYDSSHRLPPGRVDVVVAAGHVVFTTDNGIFRFDENKEVFVPDMILGKEFAGGAKPVFRMAQDNSKNIWFHSESRNFMAIPRKGRDVKIFSKPFLRLPVTQVNTIYPDPDGTNIWFGGIDGLIRYDSRVKKSTDFSFSAFIREVLVNGTTPIFGGHGMETDANDFLPLIVYKNRNLRFKCAAPCYENESATQYRYYLEGYDDDWSEWILETQKDYTNLDSGTYRFRVQARDVYENSSKEGVFRFRVLPPWTKTWWAFLIYGILFLLLMLLVVKWRSWKLVKEKQKLERIIKERTKEINRKNQQLEEQTLQLKDQSEKLKEMDRVKSRFFANISHEFRTPLTLIMGPLEHMISNRQDKDQEKTLKIMLRNSQRLLTLINQLLDLSRIDSGKMKLQASCQDIVPFLKGIFASFELLAAQNQLELEFYSEKENIDLYFDSQKIEQVITNLLINAVKFTPPGGKIRVSVTVTGNSTNENEGEISPGFVEISISDTGIGIPQDQLLHIFDRFYQAGGPDKGEQLRKGTGTGIGLALTKELVTLHHGKIDVHSRTGKDSGTEFIIQLPLGKEHLKPDEIAEVTTSPSNLTKSGEIPGLYMMKEEDETRVTRKKRKGKEQESTDIEPEAQHQQEQNVILVVEDHADVRRYIRETLEPYYTVMEAKDGRQGIKMAKEIIPDLVISDIMMPEADGYELCR
ncbi:MAG: response regulator, partial [Candidatus Aminicenantes bacterium]